MALDHLALAPDQRSLLAGMPFDGHHLVNGPPGSGKSALAVQRAVMLALTGEPVTLLTRSNLLRQSLEPDVTALGPEDGLTVSTVHRWLHDWNRSLTGDPAPQTADGWFDWPVLFQRAATRPPTGQGPLLVIDEGQDLPSDFYRLCRLLGARTTVFADECQRLTDTQSTLAEIAAILKGQHRYDLTANHRNTRPVASLAARFHVGLTPPSLPERDGPAPVLHRYDRAAHVADHIVAHARRHPGRRTGVILRHTAHQLDLLALLERRLPAGRVTAYVGKAEAGRYRTLDLVRPGVTLLTRASAKGLDFDTVFVPDTHLDAGDDPGGAALRMAYYVLITRARQELCLGYAGVTEPPLLRGVGPDVLTRVDAS